MSIWNLTSKKNNSMNKCVTIFLKIFAFEVSQKRVFLRIFENVISISWTHSSPLSLDLPITAKQIWKLFFGHNPYQFFYSSCIPFTSPVAVHALVGRGLRTVHLPCCELRRSPAEPLLLYFIQSWWVAIHLLEGVLVVFHIPESWWVALHLQQSW